jgi:hypothetical protein
MAKKSQSKKQRSGLADEVWIMASTGISLPEIAKRLNLSLEETRALRAEAGESIRQHGLELIKQRRSQKPRKITRADFLRWLDACHERFGSVLHWPLNLTRFTYFQSELCWDASCAMSHAQAVQDFESSYKAAHEQGDPEAIMEFAKDNREAISRPWVIQQLLAWRLMDSAEGFRLFNRFMRTYYNRKGKRTQARMLEIIKLDTAVYKDSLTWTKGPMRSGLAKRYKYGIDNVKDVLRHYRAAYQRWKADPRTRLILSSNSPR